MRFPLVLFDLDGVLIHTEPAYTAFWAEIGREYFPENPDFAPAIKGHSLTDILHTYFNGAGSKADEVVARLSAFQRQMDFPLIPGALEFVQELRTQGVRTAVVTSSDREKMERLYEAIPSFPTLFDRIFTAEDAGRSKPAPDCYLRAAAAFGLEASACAVFEDSPSGLEAARRSGARVYGVASELSPEAIRPLCDEVVEDFRLVHLD